MYFLGYIHLVLLSRKFMSIRSGNFVISSTLTSWDSKITEDGDCSHEIKKMLAP